MAAKYYELPTEPKKVHLLLNPEALRSIRTIQVMMGVSETEAVETAVNALYRENLAKHAKEQGLLMQTPNLSLERQNFEDKEHCEGIFDELCEKLNLNGSDGSTSSIQGVCIEVNKSWVEK